MPTRLRRNQDPDDLLQHGVDLLADEIRRIDRKKRAQSPACPKCGSGGEVTKEEREFLLRAVGELRRISSESLDAATQRQLRNLSQGQLQEMQASLQQKGGGRWRR